MKFPVSKRNFLEYNDDILRYLKRKQKDSIEKGDVKDLLLVSDEAVEMIKAAVYQEIETLIFHRSNMAAFGSTRALTTKPYDGT